MEREKLADQFSRRLINTMTNEGHVSGRSKDRIDIAKLAKAADCSYQMARRYTLGQAMPELHVIFQIASWLNTSPSWLVFGEKETIRAEQKSPSSVEIESELLKYILHKCTVLFPPTHEADKIVNYIAGVIYDAAQIDTDNETMLKIIDMMLSSAIQLTSIRHEKRA